MLTVASVFGKTNFKGKQKEIMENAVKGRLARCVLPTRSKHGCPGQDILVVAPTGMGKSLCFQVPAVAEEHGLTLVVTPLICEYHVLMLTPARAELVSD